MIFFSRTIDTLCLLDLGRSRVISGHSRDIGYLIIVNIWNIGICRKGKEFGRPGGERLGPSVSVKDRSLSGPVIMFELY